MFAVCNALVASSCDSYWTNAKFLLILTLTIFPYGSKCLSKSLVLVWWVSKLITNKVFEGLVLAEDFLEPPGLLMPRSCCHTNIKVLKHNAKLKQTEQKCDSKNYQPKQQCRYITFVHSTRSLRPFRPNSVRSSLRIASSASLSFSI